MCLPVIASCFGVRGFGQSPAAAPRASIFYGQKRPRVGRKRHGSCFTLQVIVSLVLTAVHSAPNRPLLAFGASENTIEHVVQL